MRPKCRIMEEREAIMKNFIFISPNFPETYWLFCAALKRNGMRVLGIGDCPFDQLSQDLRESLHEYYRVSNLENYDEVFRAVAFFTYKYGKIDWLESNNEFWLERDARLRTEFHITTGFMAEDMDKVKRKSAMKQYYAQIGVPTARYHLVEDLESARAFIRQVGYPVVVKPDNGVGASHTYRLRDDEELCSFFDHMDEEQYIMEEYVDGFVQTYDAIIDSRGEPMFESGNVTPHSLMDIVNGNGESLYYIVKELPPRLLEIGRKTVKAFGVKSRFVHLEYFVLNKDQEGLGKKGDLLGLEVNMRPAGGYTPDLYDFAYETNVYQIWADMVAFDRTAQDPYHVRRFCAFIGRRDGRRYVMDHQAIIDQYGTHIKMSRRIPKALSGAMADQMYVAVFDTKEEMETFYRNLLATRA